MILTKDTALSQADFEKGCIILFDKEYRWTSFDLVRKVRNLLTRHTGNKKLKVGHAGTLDPLATGLLIVCTGKMTKKIEELQNTRKEYITTFEFGKTTPCFDLEKPFDKEYPYSHITYELIKEKIGFFLGEIEQIPPLFSAKLVDGKRAYNLARNGSNHELAPSRIVIYETEIISFNNPYLELRIVCSKGTYIRSLARDLGTALGSGAYVKTLCRTKSGEFDVKKAIKIKDFEKNLLSLRA